jgi:hypothetical protein
VEIGWEFTTGVVNVDVSYNCDGCCGIFMLCGIYSFSEFYYECGKVIIWSSVDTYEDVCWCGVSGGGVYMYSKCFC